jgi:hypothetical protein
MIGPIVLGAALLYLLISIGVVRGAIRYARASGKSAKRWGWSAVLVMYLIPFWDWLPTVATHQFYCAKDSGFWVYKTLDQWKAENPGVMEALVANKGAPSNYVGNEENYIETYFLNSRFNWVVKKNGPFLLNRWRREQRVVDSKTGEVLARYVDFATGNGNIGGEPELRLWLHVEHCIGGDHNQGMMYSFEHNVKGVEN